MKENEIESQEKKILRWMRAGRSITAIGALKMANSFRLSARIFNIKKRLLPGESIVSTTISRNGKNFSSYKIVKK